MTFAKITEIQIYFDNAKSLCALKTRGQRMNEGTNVFKHGCV